MMTHVMFRSPGRLLLGLVALFVLLGAAAGGLAAVARQSERGTVSFGSKRYAVRVVATDADRERGLSGTTSLPKDQGMLFAYGSDGKWGIWMKDMNYPIDIVWLDQSKTVVHVVENALPSSYPLTVFRPKQPARYVLELAAGSIADASIAAGSRATFDVTIPAAEGVKR